MKTLACLSFALFALLCSCEKQATVVPEKPIAIQTNGDDKPKDINLTSNPSAEQLVDNNTIYEFINSFIASDTSYFNHCNTIVGRNHFPPFMEEIDSLQVTKADTLFSKADVDFIFRQARYSTTFKVDETKLSEERTVINPELCEVTDDGRIGYWRNIHKQFGSLCFISMPLFSVDKKTAIIKLSYSCGTLCGSGGLYIYKKTNSKWKLIAAWDEWVS